MARLGRGRRRPATILRGKQTAAPPGRNVIVTRNTTDASRLQAIVKARRTHHPEIIRAPSTPTPTPLVRNRSSVHARAVKTKALVLRRWAAGALILRGGRPFWLGLDTLSVVVYVPVMEQTSVARKVREARDSTGLSQVKFAEKIGASGRAVQAWEYGTRTPRMDALRQMSRVTGKPVAWFFEEEAA